MLGGRVGSDGHDGERGGRPPGDGAEKHAMVRLATPKPGHVRFLLIGVLMAAHLLRGGPEVRADGQKVRLDGRN